MGEDGKTGWLMAISPLKDEQRSIKEVRRPWKCIACKFSTTSPELLAAHMISVHWDENWRHKEDFLLNVVTEDSLPQNPFTQHLQLQVSHPQPQAWPALTYGPSPRRSPIPGLAGQGGPKLDDLAVGSLLSASVYAKATNTPARGDDSLPHTEIEEPLLYLPALPRVLLPAKSLPLFVSPRLVTALGQDFCLGSTLLGKQATMDKQEAGLRS